MYDLKYRNLRARSAGFTLIEMLIVLSLIAVLAGISVLAYRGDRSKGTVLYSKMTQYGDALIRMQLDTSCYPVHTGALLTTNTTANSQCGQDLTPNWRGPYAKADSVDANDDILIQDVGTDVVLTIAQGNNINGTGMTRQWYLQASNVPDDIATEAVDICNHGKATGRCVKGPAAPGGTTTVQYIFDERP